jgi:hypothetical protein
MQTVCTIDDGEISTVVCTVMRTPGSIFSTLSLFLRYDLSINIQYVGMGARQSGGYYIYNGYSH